MNNSGNFDDYLVWAILATIFCACLSHCGIVFAAQAKGHLSSGDPEA